MRICAMKMYVLCLCSVYFGDAEERNKELRYALVQFMVRFESQR